MGTGIRGRMLVIALSRSAQLKHLLATFALGVFVVACSGSSPSPTTPSTTPSPSPMTRVVALSGNLAFGDVAAGSTATSVLTIANTGTATLTVTGMRAPSASSGIYKANWVSGSIAPGGSQAVTITFSPVAAISYNGTLTVDADQTSGNNSLPISGSGAASSRVTLVGVVTSEAGERLSGIILKIIDGLNAGRTATSANGDYRFDNLSVGNANLSASGSGLSPTIKGLFINGANTLDFTLGRASAQPPPSSRRRLGAICNDGSSSSATGSGACSHHGGVRCWRYTDGTCTLP